MNVTIYTKNNCSYCNSAKLLMASKGIQYKELKLGEDFTRETLLEMFPNAKTYPLIIVDDVIVGGYTEFKTLVENKATNSQKFLAENLDMGEWNGA